MSVPVELPMPRSSLIVPIYNNEENLPSLLAALRDLHGAVTDLEIVLVVDGSPDGSLEILEAALPGEPFPSQLIVHSRNFGSFAAVRTGLEAARGDFFAAIAADLQEPPELVIEFLDRLHAGGVDLIFGVRANRADPWFTRFTSRVFWSIYRRWVVPDMPSGGVDVFACNRPVRDAVLSLEASNSSLMAQLFWVGFRRDFVSYQRRQRQDGESGWTVRRRLRYMADSVFSFSDLPIVALMWLGLLGIGFTFSLSFLVLVGRLAGAIPVPGYATIVLSISLLFSILLTTQGIIGMYLWRAFENTKHLPSSLVRERHVHAGEGQRP